MKYRRNIYFISGTILILINLLLDISELYRTGPVTTDIFSSLGYFLGSHFFIIFGIFLLGMAHKLNKKIKKKEDRSIEKSIEKIGTPE